MVRASGAGASCVIGYDAGFLSYQSHEEAAAMLRRTRHDFEPETFWRDLIDCWNVYGHSVTDFCATHRMSQATFYAWRKRLATRTRSTTAPTPAFAPVRLVPDPKAEVLLLTGLIVRVPTATDPVVVAQLVAAVGSAAC